MIKTKKEENQTRKDTPFKHTPCK